jgi:nucleotide-binding universal stress UspA family protein
MTKVLAAVDNSLVCKAVLETARALGDLLGAEVEALHVGDGDDRTLTAAVAKANVSLAFATGEVVDALAEAGAAEEVAAMVIGGRGMPNDPRPLGSTALAIATSLLKPVVVVPPETRPPTAMRRVLVPLEGTVSTSLAPRSIIEVARGAEIDVLVLHVHDAATLPSFTDQPQHEGTAWAREFLARYCPWGVGLVELETRVGTAEAVVPEVADESGCDLIALGWSQDLGLGRASVVKAALERARVPVMLVPVVAPTSAEHGPLGEAVVEEDASATVNG